MQSMEQSSWTVKEDSSFISSLLSHSMSHISKYIFLDDTYGPNLSYVTRHHK